MKLVKVILGGLMLAAAPLAALAEDMSYSFVDLAYIDTDIDGVGPSLDGFALRGSVGFAKNWFAFGEYVAQSVGGVDLETFVAGAGGHYGLAENLDPWAVSARRKWEIGSGPSASATTATSWSRPCAAASEIRRVRGGVRYMDFSDGGDATSLFVAGRFHFTDMVSRCQSRTATTTSSMFACVRASF